MEGGVIGGDAQIGVAGADSSRGEGEVDLACFARVKDKPLFPGAELRIIETSWQSDPGGAG
jgi:hypothetical protein